MHARSWLRQIVLVATGVCFLWATTACSVVMALKGKQHPHLEMLHVGSTREDVEAQLGTPVESHRTTYGAQTDIYEYETGNEPSTARAVVYAIYDVLSLGLYEIIFTFAELMLGEKRRLPIYYGPDGLVAGINEAAPNEPPAPNTAGEPQKASLEPDRPSEPPAFTRISDVDVVPAGRARKRTGAHAVVIGVGQYREKLPVADFADRDASLMGHYVTDAMGYPDENVVVLLNERASKSDLEKYLEVWLPNRVEPDDTVFVYYSGHGAPNPKTGDAYLIPYDGDPAFVTVTGYPLRRLYETLRALPAKEVVVVVDSCFSGAGGRSVIAKGMRPVGISVENPVLAGGRTVVLTASAGDQVSSTYDAKGHGLFTYFFLKGLQGEADPNKDGVIELGEVYAYLRPQVERVARREFNNEQTPQLLGSPQLLKGRVRLVEPTIK